MSRHMKKIFVFTAAFLLAASSAHAQDPAAGYPSRTIRIFGQGTGSTADYLSRYVALKLTERWGRPVLVASGRGPAGTLPTARAANPRRAASTHGSAPTAP